MSSSSRSLLARGVSKDKSPSFDTGPVYDSGEEEKPRSTKSSGTEGTVGLTHGLSFIVLTARNRDGAINLWLRIALARDETDEIEGEREERDVSETIDSGEEAVETEVAREERRTGQ
jgi:hypothetical protein